MAEFVYQTPFPLGADTTEYRSLGKEFVSTATFEGEEILKVQPEALSLVAREALRDVSFLYRPAHLQKVAAILDDPDASNNDRGVAMALLKNAVVASGWKLPMCQDTGTATIVAKKGQRVWTGAKDEEWLSKGIFETYQNENLRYSQTIPLSMFEEVNSGTNLPAQIDLLATNGSTYEFLFVAKGGGSANKSFLYQETKALLNPASLEKFLREKLRSLGTAACPPYHLAVVIGGTSAEATMKTVKLASAGYLDHLPTEGNRLGQAFRDTEMENKVMELARTSGIGAQFGGKYFALDARVIRLPRHGASCPVGLGVSCSADRNIKARIDRDGVWLEKLERDPARFIPAKYRAGLGAEHGVNIDLNRPMADVLSELSKYPVSTPLKLNGTIVVARDIAHAKIKERLDRGDGMPDYLKQHPVYYAGPAKTPEGMPSGSFGPTTAGRMDSYVDQFQANGGSMVMIAKGNRSQAVTDACKKHGGFYLGSIGGPAALLAHDNIKKVELIEYPELGMEAVYQIDVVDFPAFILVDDKGNEFFSQLPILS
ncbi:fumarate hydratase [Paludisphaera borealis]|uniref:Fumarate hydratase class I n=1 Tax=Paludisphaera borealis TaxID=1387353 RepID=A0A1U7CPD3_9BACT|nr:fumarate hydratase [Paludisphaera borealis]APW60766.1 Fumarate hydratase class I, aerobic [Paludisphaera borealis]MDR3621345.1 fumarate hydratase [Paludisphaera borealis]